MTVKDEDFAFELDDELLKSIAGGQLSEGQESNIYRLVQTFKKLGKTKEAAKGVFLSSIEGQLLDDTLSYIDEIWDSVTI